MDGAAVASLGFAAAVEAAQRAAAFKVYVPGNPGWCVALVPSCNRLVVRAANPTDPYQRWEKNVVSVNSFELVNRGSGRSIMNVHILPPILVGSAQFHPRLLRATARWEEGVAGGGFAADVGDGGIDIFCVSVMRNHYLALKIAPWGHDQRGGGGGGVESGWRGERDEDYAGAGAGEDDAAATATASTRNTSSRCCGRLRCLFPRI